jgi:hypothetical protein
VAHTRADSDERQSALDGMYQEFNELERLVSDGEAQQDRMQRGEGQKAKDTRDRFSAFGGAR